MRRPLIRQGKLYAGFRSLGVNDYLVVVRCNRRQDLGHMAKQCSLEEELCGHCGKSGHRKAKCPDEGKEAKSISAIRKGKLYTTNREN